MAALAAAVLNLPQPFLTVLAVVLLCGTPPPSSWKDGAGRVVSAWCGCLTGVLLIILLPEQPWLALPLFGALAGIGTLFISSRYGYAQTLLFGMGVCASAPAAAIRPDILMSAALAHGTLLTIGVIATILAFPPKASAALPTPLSPRSAGTIGLACTISLIAALLIVPGDVVVMVIATLTTILRLEWPESPSALPQKAVGAVLGALSSLAFIILVAGSGNDIAVFLLALGLMVATFEVTARRYPAWAISARQAAALFAVAAPMIPRPDQFLAAADSRILAVLGGCCVAALCHCCARATEFPAAPQSSASSR
jgi:hypothetical protein